MLVSKDNTKETSMKNGKTIGDIGEAKVLADLIEKGYTVLVPWGDNLPYDLVIERDGEFERIQVKCNNRNNDEIIYVSCTSSNARWVYQYTEDMVEWIACYSTLIKECYYIPSSYLQGGRGSIKLRLKPTKNNQEKKVLWAKDFKEI